MATTTRVVMPQLGESVHEGTISKWLVKPGDKVVEFEPMLEVDTDKVNAEVPAPVSGILREILAKEGETVQAGAEIAVVETGDGATATPESQKVEPQAPSPPRGEGRAEGEAQAASPKAVPQPPSPPRGEGGGEGGAQRPEAQTQKVDGGEHRYAPGEQRAAPGRKGDLAKVTRTGHGGGAARQ